MTTKEFEKKICELSQSMKPLALSLTRNVENAQDLLQGKDVNA